MKTSSVKVGGSYNAEDLNVSFSNFKFTIKINYKLKQKLLTETGEGDILLSRVETMLEFWC